MNCEDLWSRIETGNVVERLVARWHAARCPRCRESLAKLNAIKGELATTEPPSPEQRRLWERCTASQVAFPGYPRRRATMAAAFAVAAALALAIGAWVVPTWHTPEQPPVVGRGPTPVERESAPEVSDDDSLRRIEEMRSGLLAMSDKLDELSRTASLLDERKQVNDLLSSCPPLRTSARN